MSLVRAQQGEPKKRPSEPDGLFLCFSYRCARKSLPVSHREIGGAQPPKASSLAAAAQTPSSPNRGSQEKALAFASAFSWLGMKDLNPHKQSQSLSCCHYTNPQYSVCAAFCNGYYYSRAFPNCQVYFRKNRGVLYIFLRADFLPKEARRIRFRDRRTIGS